MRVIIAIQARSTSSRLPGKVTKKLFNKPLLSWVLNACFDSATYITKNSYGKTRPLVVLLCPKGDPLLEQYNKIMSVEGPEEDVLTRYVMAAKKFRADYICRITSDCPFLTGWLITNHIFKCTNASLDYLSNVDEDVRTEADGRDIEVFSKRALDWLDTNAKTPEEREHVTVKLRRDKPRELRRGHCLNRLDMTDLKISIDTAEDFERAEERIKSFLKKKRTAEGDVGNRNVFYI